jgi:TonB-linked SusC/RagA family outer membrane protein
MIFFVMGKAQHMRRLLPQFLKIVKLTAFLTLALLHVHARGLPQITLSLKNVPVEKVFYEIEHQAGYGFLYTKTMLSGLPKVTIQVKNASVNEVLNECFKGQPIEYSIEKNMIVVKRRSTASITSVATPDSDPPIQIHGRVLNKGGEPLQNVSVLIVGSQVGTSTNNEGLFTLNAPDNKNIELEFSSVGYQTQKIKLGNQTELNVVLETDVAGLGDVVLVGYGTRKKVNLTGSVSSVTSKDIEKRTVTQTSLALQGQMSGISVRQVSGNPGSNQGSLLIRGQGTFSGAGTSPLVLVDGIESSLDNVDPADVANVSVLKDAASAAIFGSKAANGVILVETKTGVAGKPVINYKSYVGKNQPTFVPEMINSWEYADVINSINPGTYSDADIQKFKSGTDPAFPNFDHIKYLFDSGNGIETKQNISVSGGSPAARYLFSAGYYNSQAIIKKNNADRFNFRLNVDSRLSEKLRFNLKLSGLAGDSREPSYGYGGGVGGIILGAMRNANTIPGPTLDGFWGRNEVFHPEADLNSQSFLKNQSYNFLGNAQLIWDITKDLKITGIF